MFQKTIQTDEVSKVYRASSGYMKIDPSGNRPTAFFVIFATNACPF